MPEVPVTDHAVLRYLERAKGFDVEAVRQHIWNTCRASATLGATCLRADGVKFEFAGGRVVTVVPDRPTPGKISREKSQRKVVRA